MDGRIKPYLQIIRLPNVFTAAADSLAAWLLTQGLDHPGRWVPLMVCSMAVYAAGIALNDLMDEPIDRVERPQRPLPSGAVGRSFAWRLVVSLLLLGLVAAALSGSVVSLLVASMLICCVIAYDVGGKKTVAGPLLMGGCRGLNVLLGFSQAVHLGGPFAWLYAGSIAMYIAGVTWISRSETTGGRSTALRLGMVTQCLGLILAFNVGVQLGYARRGPEGFLLWEFGSLMGQAALGFLIARSIVRAWKTPEPATIQNAVRTGILALVWIHVVVLLWNFGPVPALIVALLALPAYTLARWLYTT